MNNEIRVTILPILMTTAEQKKEGKPSLFTDDIILDLKVPPNSIRKFLDLINNFKKAT